MKPWACAWAGYGPPVTRCGQDCELGDARDTGSRRDDAKGGVPSPAAGEPQRQVAVSRCALGGPSRGVGAWGPGLDTRRLCACTGRRSTRDGRAMDAISVSAAAAIANPSGQAPPFFFPRASARCLSRLLLWASGSRCRCGAGALVSAAPVACSRCH